MLKIIMKEPIRLLHNRELYTRVVSESVLAAEKFVWIATANLKDMHVETPRGYKPILEVFNEYARQGVRFRIIHGEIPSRRFRNTLEKLPSLFGHAMELQICPRSHWKMVIVDGREAYFGSANFTGAGLGAKSEHRRNLEVGAMVLHPGFVKKLMGYFDEFWMGGYCESCAYMKNCPDPIRDR